ncbi:1-(5-phosphoribosyl)-5-[(5-phosphoribosylamino)methylideneamino]imidazole-4-carboxamide isomerase [candidate division KSB1 bacterium]|nr:1-(5-phosphoribosyl)-5-[(5-phosphoribosylamino)methylideneamino]imidazole-4-carboxamide isomerase [candidate division KSB1 bacterium]
MIIIPAIDLIGGKCVRLRQGGRKNPTIYSDRPHEQAIGFAQAGAQILHLVNLDGAFGKARANTREISKIRDSVDTLIELGGGIRTLEDVRAWLGEVGIDRIIFGTVAVSNPGLIKSAMQEFGAERIIVGIDARGDRVAVQGWEEQTEISPFDLALEMKALGVERLIYTDIGRDGMLAGPNLKNTRLLAEQSQLSVIASGGFAQMEHFQALLQEECERIEGAIVGKALYEGHLDLQELIKKYQRF